MDLSSEEILHEVLTGKDIVKDDSLRSILDISDDARKQCLEIVGLVERHASNSDAAHSLETEAEFSKEQKSLYARLSQLRGLNRNAILGVRQTKQATAEARQEIDRLHLQLQNLYYEQQHLQGEIAACEKYDHKYLLLPLITEEQFIQQHPDLTNCDEGAIIIARINHEHDQRQDLEEKRQGLLKKKQGLIAENKKRKDDIAKLDNDLEKFIEAAQPIQKAFEKEY